MAKKKKGAIKRKSMDTNTNMTVLPPPPPSTLKKRKRAMDDDGIIDSTDGDAEDDTTSTTRAVDSWRSKAVTKLSDFPRNMVKYWYSRYRLMTQYDSGVLLDLESWYSITPEAIAARTALRCCGNRNVKPATVVLDLFCGCGGNAIQFALSPSCSKVIAVDIDPIKVEMAKHNAEIYGVRSKIEFVTGDAIKYLRDAAGSGSGIDVVFLSPPWGGVSYATASAPSTPMDTSPVKAEKTTTTTANTLPTAFATTQQVFSDITNDDDDTPKQYIYYRLASLAPVPGQVLFDLARKVSKNVVMYLPRSCDLDEIASLVPSSSSSSTDDEEGEEVIDVEEQWLGDSFKALCVYFGDVAREWVEVEKGLEDK